jgi:hypothetical protein
MDEKETTIQTFHSPQLHAHAPQTSQQSQRPQKIPPAHHLFDLLGPSSRAHNFHFQVPNTRKSLHRLHQLAVLRNPVHGHKPRGLFHRHTQRPDQVGLSRELCDKRPQRIFRIRLEYCISKQNRFCFDVDLTTGQKQVQHGPFKS